MKQRSLSDKLAIETAVAPLEALLNKKAQGELLLDHHNTTAEVTLASTSPEGQEIIRNDVRALSESFHNLFKGKLFIFICLFRLFFMYFVLPSLEFLCFYYSVHNINYKIFFNFVVLFSPLPSSELFDEITNSFVLLLAF